jgi:hypothetical protein
MAEPTSSKAHTLRNFRKHALVPKLMRESAVTSLNQDGVEGTDCAEVWMATFEEQE